MGQLNPSRERQGRRRAAAAVPEETGSARLGSYLRNLREGYGYTLRKVEEQATAFGEAIDNSQLSRFEKGKAVPSFDKLRALARVFNVPVQSFSDVLDLEEFQHLKPTAEVDYAGLIKAGYEQMARGEAGRAFVTYERALEVAQLMEGTEEKHELTAEARWKMAHALKSLGKLYMTEQELRAILKDQHLLPAHTRLKTLLQLAYLYRELGDYYLATVLARECLELARSENDRAREAGVLNTLGNVQQDGGHFDEAAGNYREALDVLTDVPGHEEMRVSVLSNLGGCLVGLERWDEAVELLGQAYARARQHGYRRLAALALTWLAEAEQRRGNLMEARAHLVESDALASRPEGVFNDILFLNAYHRWQIVREENNATGEKIAFGRLRHLRSLLQRRFPEVEAFDQHVQRFRR